MTPEVLAVRYGTRTTRKREVYLHYDLYGEPDAELVMDYYFWIVRLTGHTVLVDCGFNETTPGQLVVLVGDVVLASDSLHYYEELDLDRPFTHVADLPAMYATFERLRELAITHRLVAGHDPDVMRRFPVVGDGLAARITLDDDPGGR